MAQLFPSLIAANVLRLHDEVKQLAPYCSGFHVDIMDFHFVNNLTFGPGVVNALARVTQKQLYLHLMIENPSKMIEQFQLNANDVTSFHIESTKEIEKTISQITEKKCLPSLAIRPKTPLSDLYSFLPRVNHVLLMSVEPGFSGQQFLPHSIERLKELVAYRTEHNLSFALQMDGGIDETNIVELAEIGADQFGIGSGIFGANDPVFQLKKLHDLVT